MYNVEQIDIRYEEANTILVKGFYEDFESFFKRGYVKRNIKNGSFELFRPTRFLVAGNCGEKGCFLHDMKSAILKHYNKEKMSLPITDQFNNDFKAGKICIKMDDTSAVIE